MRPGSNQRRKGREMRISYDVAASPFGRLLVAGTAHGISAIYLGDADGSLESALRKEYPEAQIRRDSAPVASWMHQLAEHLNGGRTRLRLPTDLQATAFQRQVWKELQRIPRGTQRTYREISRRIGRPGATRAVGSACARNPVSILIPCHRAVREDGGLGGYRWGLARKRALLEQEKRATQKADH